MRALCLVVVLLAACARERVDARERACANRDAHACFERATELQTQCGASPCDAATLEKLVKLMSAGCTLGHPDACHDLGYLHFAGLGLPKNVKKAAEYYEAACTRGIGRGCSNLGWLERGGEPSMRDLSAAVRHYTQGCRAGDGKGCCGEGDLRQHGLGVTADVPRALEAFDRGCETLGDSCSCAGLGTLLAHGRGVTKDEARAKQVLERACLAKESSACMELGLLFLADEPSRGRALLQQACAKQPLACAEGWRSADGGVAREGVEALEATCAKTKDCYVLAQINEWGRGVPSDGDRALEQYVAACDFGESRGCTNAGHMLLLGRHHAKDPARAYELYERGCTMGDVDACFNRAWMLQEGAGVEKDGVRSTALHSELCDRGFARSCVSLGYALEGHFGVAPDIERAVAASRRACSLGDPMGCNNLGVEFRNADAGIARDDVEALKAFEAGCPDDGGVSDDGACGMLGVLLAEAQVVARDDRRAFPLLRRGCEAAEDGESCFWLAKALREGRGVPRDVKAAAIAKARACKLEFSAACR